MKKRQVQKVTSDDVAQGQKDGSTAESSRRISKLRVALIYMGIPVRPTLSCRLFACNGLQSACLFYTVCLSEELDDESQRHIPQVETGVEKGEEIVRISPRPAQVGSMLTTL